MPRRRIQPAGFTIVELLVVVSIIALLISILLPSVKKARDKGLEVQSANNLNQLAKANETYAADWGDRQFTTIPDDAGTVGGNCTTYLAQRACPPQQFLGYDVNGAIWGYFLGNSGKCAPYGWPEACYNWIVYIPFQFGTAGNPGGGNAFGSFRMPGVKAFHAYVNGKFYDQTFYAPKDVVAIDNISKYFTTAAEFTFNPSTGAYEDSSYCFSPAAMWDPKVLARNGTELNGNGYTNPGSLPAGYRSPSVARCRYPSLKTRMIEHNWLQKPPPSQIVNPNFAGNKTPWFFNHGSNSAPYSLFFDGHVEMVSCRRAMQGDQRAQSAPNGSLWSKNTPLGGNGYFGAQSYDFLVRTSFHILTTDGIEGRDVLGSE
jgi:prepilin-type N-terminal cleavage/methylation domain-containing protein